MIIMTLIHVIIRIIRKEVKIVVVEKEEINLPKDLPIRNLPVKG